MTGDGGGGQEGGALGEEKSSSKMSSVLSVESAESVLANLGSSGRVRYSCVGLSRSYVVLGATTGSVYLYMFFFYYLFSAFC